MIYKVSYVEETGKYTGSIKNETEMPLVGNIVQIGTRDFQIIFVEEIMPPRENFQYLQATVKIVETDPNYP